MTFVFLRNTMAQVPSSLNFASGEETCKKRLSAQAVPQSASSTVLLHRRTHWISVCEVRETPQIAISDISANKRPSTSGGGSSSPVPKRLAVPRKVFLPYILPCATSGPASQVKDYPGCLGQAASRVSMGNVMLPQEPVVSSSSAYVEMSF